MHFAIEIISIAFQISTSAGYGGKSDDEVLHMMLKDVKVEGC